MLRKILAIRGVGRFSNCGAAGDVEFKRTTLVFAENGRGKTTLCAILRSVQSGDPSYVLGRSTLGATASPEISIRFDGGTAVFRNGAWSVTMPGLDIFDSTFVSENIHSGDNVDLGHKRKLYGVIVGKRGVELARRIEELDDAIRDKNAKIGEKRAVVQALVPEGLSVETFLSLQEDPAIDAKIVEKGRDLEAVKESDQIKSRAALSELNLPVLPASFEGLLAETIEGIEEHLERRIATQVGAHAMHDHGEPWLSEGLGYVRDEACPFCGQSLRGLTLIAAYNAYFSEEYHALQTKITALRTLLKAIFGDREIARLERILDQNGTAVQFWARYCTIGAPSLAYGEGLGDALRGLREAALSLLDRKAAAPLDSVPVDAAFTAAHAAVVTAEAGVSAYNQAVQGANDVVAAKKTTTESADVGTIVRTLARLRATKKRYESDGRAACQDLEAARGEKKTLEDQKASAKRQLEEHTRELVGQYEESVNGLLDDFQAGFRITGTKHAYPGGVPSCSYQILINDTAVDLGDPSTSLGRPSFRNTLSSGDKSTLALAFFLARLDHDAERASKIVVFDDPFSSQDSFRKDWTVQKIKNCCESCQQTIVLSHDRVFLKRVWDRLATQASDRKCLQLARIGLHNTAIFEWDIEQATQARFLVNRDTLVAYYQAREGSPNDVVAKIRPVLETHCRNVCPGEFLGDALGIIIGKVRAAGAAHCLFPVADELDALNEYTRPYHHGDNVGVPTETPNDAELQGFVKMTLAITGGC